MPTNTFFDESRDQSLIKATIVEKYFDAWAAIIIGAQKARPSTPQRLAYVDLFAGPGRYRDGAASTPLRVLERAIARKEYCERLIAVFNDRDEANVRALERSIHELPGIDRLRNAPEIWNVEVGDEMATRLSSINKVPTLAFIDPWGYRGLTLQLVDAFLRDWGCDCLFFFNYGRINAGLNNPFVRTHMQALFGASAARLGETLLSLSPSARESTIVNELAVALQRFGHRYVLPFCFKNETGRRTTHHLIFVTKSFKGYEVMKQIMANSSSLQEQGVASFSYSPADSNRQALLFEFNRPVDDLRQMLLADYGGRTITMREIYEEHSVGKPFLARHYKEILKALEDAGAIQTEGRRSRRGFADNIFVRFPP